MSMPSPPVTTRTTAHPHPREHYIGVVNGEMACITVSAQYLVANPEPRPGRG